MENRITLAFVLLFNLVKTEYYTEANVSSVFDYFKQKYSKKYRDDEAESYALRNFVTNLNQIESLNKNATHGQSLYVANKFTDINPEEYEQKYAVNVLPYDNVAGNDMKDEYLRQERVKNKGNGLMYDLDDAEDLYQEYLKKFNKTEPEGKTRKLKQYLRFVKSLVEINKKHFEGNMQAVMDDKADVIKEPNKLFF